MPVANFESHLKSDISMETEAVSLAETMPFRLLMMGDWAGDSPFFGEISDSGRLLEVDRDNFEELIGKIRPQANLVFADSPNQTLNLTFESLDDFHPDNIFQKVSLFSELKDIRRRLKNADTFASAAKEVKSWYNSESEVNNDSEFHIGHQTNESLLDSILEKQPLLTNPQVVHKSELSKFISDIVSPYILKTDLEEQSKLIGIVDEVISDLMRKILHHEDFQKLESAWRGLYFLVKNAVTDTYLKIYLFHLSKVELVNNLRQVNTLADSVYHNVVNNKYGTLPETHSWALVSANYDFQINVEDIATLIRISEISEIKNTPFISNIDPEVFGFTDNDSTDFTVETTENPDKQKLWLALRLVPTSEYIGMTLPRFIGRLPYGMTTDPTETIDFEEFTEMLQQSNYLWIPATFAYSLVLAQEFRSKSWNINTNKYFDLENLPLHIRSSQDSVDIGSCVEIRLSESNFIKALEEGVMPVVSFRNSDSIRLSSLRSVSLESPILKGKWNSK